MPLEASYGECQVQRPMDGYGHRWVQGLRVNKGSDKRVQRVRGTWNCNLSSLFSPCAILGGMRITMWTAVVPNPVTQLSIRVTCWTGSTTTLVCPRHRSMCFTRPKCIRWVVSPCRKRWRRTVSVVPIKTAFGFRKSRKCLATICRNLSPTWADLWDSCSGWAFSGWSDCLRRYCTRAGFN